MKNKQGRPVMDRSANQVKVQNELNNVFKDCLRKEVGLMKIVSFSFGSIDIKENFKSLEAKFTNTEADDLMRNTEFNFTITNTGILLKLTKNEIINDELLSLIDIRNYIKLATFNLISLSSAEKLATRLLDGSQLNMQLIIAFASQLAKTYSHIFMQDLRNKLNK